MATSMTKGKWIVVHPWVYTRTPIARGSRFVNSRIRCPFCESMSMAHGVIIIEAQSRRKRRRKTEGRRRFSFPIVFLGLLMVFLGLS